MAIISKILSLPSATQYEAQPTVSQSTIYYSNSSFGSGSSRNTTYFDFPPTETFWKNKASTVQNAILEYYDSPTASWIQAFLQVLSSGVNSQNYMNPESSRIGVRHRVRTYARANGTDVYSNIVREYYPQTKPNKSPQITSYSIGPYQVSASWNAIGDVNWGGAPSNSINDDRQYEFILEKDPGTSGAQFIVRTEIGEALNYVFGGSFSGNYRIIIYAVNKAGDSTFLFENPPTTTYGSATPIVSVSQPPFFPSFGPSFGGGGGPKSLYSNTKVRTPNGLVLASQLQVGDVLTSVVLPGLSEDGWTPQDVIDWNIENPEFDLSNTVTTTIVDIVHSITDKIFFINGDAFSASHRIMVNRDNVARMISALDIVETDLIWSPTDTAWVAITSLESFDSTHDVYSVNCEPYDIFFTENMLVHDTRPNISS